MTSPEEPQATIYGPDWRATQRRLHLLREPTLISALRATFKHLEEGWKTVRPIQSFNEAHRARTDMDPVTVAVLYFLEVEIVDRYRILALEMIRAVPLTRRAKVSTEGFDDVQSEMELVRNYFRKMAEVAEPVRGLAASAGTLVSWTDEFEGLFSEVESTLKASGLDDSDDG